MQQSKPIIPNNYNLDDGREILYRIFDNKDIEIYKTNTENYVNLLKKDMDISLSKKQKYGIKEIFIGKSKYHIFDSIKNIQNNVNEIIKDLTIVSGFDAVAGMEDLKAQLIQDIIYPLTQKEKFKKFKLSIPNGILLYGPLGCGKTFIVRKLAEELNFSYFEVKHSDVTTPYIHGGVGKIAEVFNLAKLKAPAIVFIDELDGLAPERSLLDGTQSYKLEEVNEFLTHLNDAGKNNILVIGATNQPELIDKAILRSGRFDKKIYVMPPDFEARIHLFKMYLSDRPTHDIDYDVLAGQTVGYSCSDIELICNEAARIAAINDYENISQDLLLEIRERTNSSII